jgi:hypothetical protein
MEFQKIGIEVPSARVLGKLRKGKAVRIMSGEGMKVMVGSSKMKPITKAFKKGKAYTMRLSPEEIKANMEGEMEGSGVFDFLNPVVQPLGSAILSVGSKEAKKQVGKAIGTYAPILGSTLGSAAFSGLALAAGQPELVPVAAAMGERLGKAGGKALGKVAQKESDKQIDKYTAKAQTRLRSATTPTTRRASVAPPSRTPVSQGERAISASPMGAANVEDFLARLSMADLEELLQQRRQAQGPYDYSGGRRVLSPYADPVGYGLFAGGGLYASGGRGLYAQNRGSGVMIRNNVRRMDSGVGGGGSLLATPQAVQSQPFTANFQFGRTMPPALAAMYK